MAIAGAGQAPANNSRSHTWLRGLSLATVISVFSLVILGGVVRVTGSGLGCPEWPTCDGGLLPPLESKAIIEFSHRIVASILVGPLIIATCVVAWIFHRREVWLVGPATVALVLVIVQALLGGATVLSELPGGTVMAHLTVGEALLGSLVLLTVVAYRGPLQLQTPSWAVGKIGRFPSLSAVSAVGIFALLISGSYLTITGSTGACSEWPLCNGDTFPEHRLQMIHMAHRYVALVVGLIVLYTLHLGFRGRTQPLEIRVLSMSAAALFLGQVMAGAGTVWADFPEELRALHLALATGVWGAIAALVVLTRSSEPSSVTGVAHG